MPVSLAVSLTAAVVGMTAGAATTLVIAAQAVCVLTAVAQLCGVSGSS